VMRGFLTAVPVRLIEHGQLGVFGAAAIEIEAAARTDWIQCSSSSFPTRPRCLREEPDCVRRTANANAGGDPQGEHQGRRDHIHVALRTSQMDSGLPRHDPGAAPGM